MQLSVLASLWSTLGHSTTWKPSYKTTKTWNLAHKFGFAVKKSKKYLLDLLRKANSSKLYTGCVYNITNSASSFIPFSSAPSWKSTAGVCSGFTSFVVHFFFQNTELLFFCSQEDYLPVLGTCWFQTEEQFSKQVLSSSIDYWVATKPMICSLKKTAQYVHPKQKTTAPLVSQEVSVLSMKVLAYKPF